MVNKNRHNQGDTNIYVADDIVELMHAGFDNRFGDLDTETGLNETIYDNNHLQPDSTCASQGCTETESDL